MKKMIETINRKELTWLYSVGLVAGMCLMGAEGETLTQTAISGIIGMAAVVLFGFLLAGEIERQERSISND